MTKPIYHPTNYRKNITLYWKQFYPNWSIPTGYHVHHIRPKCTFDNKDDPAIHHPKNLIALHPDDHVLIHTCRGDKISKHFILSVVGVKHKIGQKRSPEQCQNISNAKKGKPNGHLGMKRSKETKALFSKQRKGMYTGTKSPMFSGYYHTPFGTFSARSQQSIISPYQILKWCKEYTYITKESYFRSDYLQTFNKDIIGKTFRDIGFWFEPI